MPPDIRRVRQAIHPLSVLEGAGRGVSLKRSFPSYVLDYPDPFLLFDHFASDDPADFHAGFPMHPHRGIETVTYMLDGAMAHRDNLGNTGSIGPGDVQWLTAGSGILHEEMPQPGVNSPRLEGFQLWINLPGYLKMSRPSYQEISAASIPAVERSDGSTVRVISGEMDGVIGPAMGVSGDPVFLDISLPAGCYFSLPTPPDGTCLAYLYRGQAEFGPVRLEDEAEEEPIPAMPLSYSVPGREPPGGLAAAKLVVFEDGDQLAARSPLGTARFLLLLGRSLHEPIVRHGSIVMHTIEELEDTLRDIHNGMFIPPV